MSQPVLEDTQGVRRLRCFLRRAPPRSLRSRSFRPSPSNSGSSEHLPEPGGLWEKSRSLPVNETARDSSSPEEALLEWRRSTRAVTAHRLLSAWCCPLARSPVNEPLRDDRGMTGTQYICAYGVPPCCRRHTMAARPTRGRMWVCTNLESAKRREPGPEGRPELGQARLKADSDDR